MRRHSERSAEAIETTRPSTDGLDGVSKPLRTPMGALKRGLRAWIEVSRGEEALERLNAAQPNAA